MNSTVLVLDANQRSALAVIRSLGKISGLRVLAADAAEETIGGHSRYCQQFLTHPSIETQPLEFLDWIASTIARLDINMVFPCTEISSQLLMMNKEALAGSQIPFASIETVMSLANKGQLLNLAKTVDVATPESMHFNAAQQVNLSKVKTYPVVIKPCLSRIWLGDSWLNTEVQIAYNVAELEEYLTETEWLQKHEFMLQEFIQGYGAGLFAVYDHGKPVAFFAHQRLREKPPEGGVSVLSKSVPLDPLLTTNTQRLLDACQWHGVAMVEFRIAQDGTPYLMEVNTRFWGTLQLAIDAGVDFPALLYRITAGQNVSLQKEYKAEVRLRWLLGDIDSLYLALKSPHFSLTDKIKRIVSFFIPHFFSTRHQVSRFGDLKPGLVEFKQYIAALRN